MVSSRAQRGCGFTFEVQQLGKERLSWGLKAEAFSWGVVVGGDGCGEGVVVDGVEVCLARQGSSHAADGGFHGALLPGTVGVVVEGPHSELVGGAFVLGSGRGVSPGVVVGAADLGVDEAVDGFVADGCRGLLLMEPAGDLLGRPAALQAAQSEATQLGITFQRRARPAAGGGLFLGVVRLVADVSAMVALQLTRDARWRAIQSCRDLAERFAGFAKLGPRAALVEGEVVLKIAHSHTLVLSCTS